MSYLHKIFFASGYSYPGPITVYFLREWVLNQNIDGEILCFTDDTAIIFSTDSIISMQEKINVESWLNNYFLQINFDKSSFIQFEINGNYNP